jgi:hypothetical protein
MVLTAHRSFITNVDSFALRAFTHFALGLRTRRQAGAHNPQNPKLEHSQ